MRHDPRVMTAKRAAYRKAPYAADCILSLVPVEKPGLGTCAVDQYWRLYYDPDYLSQVTDQQAAYLMLHEVLHLMLKHHLRASAVASPSQNEQWNYATDMAIWCVLDQMGASCDAPEGAVKPQDYGFPFNKTAEEYFELLLRKEEDESKSNGNDSTTDTGAEQGSGERSSEGGTTPEGHGERNDGHDEHDVTSASADPGTPGGGGSCSDGDGRDWELDQPGDGEAGLKHYEGEILISEAAKKMEDYKGRGKLPGCFDRIIDDILRPKMDPRVLLQSVISQCLNEITSGRGGRYSYRRPSRRPHHAGLLRPRAFRCVPQIVVIIDTSGSMYHRELSLSVGLIAKCLEAMSLRDGIRVIAGDTFAQWDEKVFDPSKITLAGGGGTDMSQLIKEVAKDKPDLIICCTDGETPWPEENVNVPVVACLTRKCDWSTPPEWMKTVELI